MPIYNLTQHNLTQTQIAEGGVELPHELRKKLVELLTVGGEELRSPILPDLLEARARAILGLLWPLRKKTFVSRVDEVNEMCCADMVMEAMNELKEPLLTVMVGGFPPLMDRLIPLLKGHQIQPVYALSERVVHEEVIDGKVQKTVVFDHVGWFPA